MAIESKILKLFKKTKCFLMCVQRALKMSAKCLKYFRFWLDNGKNGKKDGDDSFF